MYVFALQFQQYGITLSLSCYLTITFYVIYVLHKYGIEL